METAQLRHSGRWNKKLFSLLLSGGGCSCPAMCCSQGVSEPISTAQVWIHVSEVTGALGSPARWLDPQLLHPSSFSLSSTPSQVRIFNLGCLFLSFFLSLSLFLHFYKGCCSFPSFSTILSPIFYEKG